MKKVKILFLMILLVFTSIFIGCSNKSYVETDNKVNKETTAENKTNIELETIKIGIDGETPPFTTIQENGEAGGFEVALWKEIGKRLNVDVEFEIMEFSSLFSMLDDGRLDVVANVIAVTPEREEKYLFSDGYIYERNMLLAHADKKIDSIKEMDGWTVAVEPASVDEGIVEVFEKKEGIKLERVYYDGAAIQDVVLGRVDLWIKGEAGCLEVIDKIGKDKLQMIADTSDVAISGYPFAKNEKGEILQKNVNEALKEIRNDGTMTKLAEEYLAIDITKVPGQN